MRWCLGVVVVANLVFFAWFQSSQEIRPQVNVHSPLPVEGSSAAGGIATQRLLIKSLQSRLVQEGAAEANICWRIGPMAEKITAKQVQSRFEQLGLDAVMISQSRDGEMGYQIYQGPFTDEASAMVATQRLQVAGYASARVVPGETGFLVALEHHLTRAPAQMAVDQLLEQGFTVALREQRSTIESVSLGVMLRDDENIPPLFWLELDADFHSLIREKKWCGTIALMG